MKSSTLSNSESETLQQISRERAEELFQNAQPVETKIEQTPDELKLFFSISPNQLLLVVYDTKKHIESFYIDQKI